MILPKQKLVLEKKYSEVQNFHRIPQLYKALYNKQTLSVWIFKFTIKINNFKKSGLSLPN